MNSTRKVSGGELPDALLQALGDALKPAELGQGQRDRMRNNVMERARRSVPEGTLTLRAADSAWITIAPLVEARELRRDQDGRNHTSLLRMLPGGIIPSHRHEQDEEFILLEGECHIGTHHLHTGDAHFAAAGSWHDTITTTSGVLVLLRGEYPYPRESVPNTVET